MNRKKTAVSSKGLKRVCTLKHLVNDLIWNNLLSHCVRIHWNQTFLEEIVEAVAPDNILKILLMLLQEENENKMLGILHH